MIISTLQMRKLRHEQVKSLVQDDTADTQT